MNLAQICIFNSTTPVEKAKGQYWMWNVVAMDGYWPLLERNAHNHTFCQQLKELSLPEEVKLVFDPTINVGFSTGFDGWSFKWCKEADLEGKTTGLLCVPSIISCGHHCPVVFVGVSKDEVAGFMKQSSNFFFVGEVQLLH